MSSGDNADAEGALLIRFPETTSREDVIYECTAFNSLITTNYAMKVGDLTFILSIFFAIVGLVNRFRLHEANRNIEKQTETNEVACNGVTVN